MKWTATAVWYGSGLEGNGHLSTDGSTLDQSAFSFKSRFSNESAGTNPEELLAAAHASCFTMKLAFVLNEYGYTAERLRTTATVNLVNGIISNSHLNIEAKIPNMIDEDFRDCVERAKREGPIGQLLHPIVSCEIKLIMS